MKNQKKINYINDINNIFFHHNNDEKLVTD